MTWGELSDASLCPDGRVALGWHLKLPVGIPWSSLLWDQ